MTQTLCAVDDQPTDGETLCGYCLERLAVRLREVPGLVDELETTIARQDKLGARGGGGSKPIDPPMPFNVAASDARVDLRDKLVSWVKDVAERSGAPFKPLSWDRASADASVWLLGHLRAVQHHPAAGDLYEEVTEAVWRAVKAVDRPPDRVFAGWCCAALYASPGRSTVTCRGCGMEYDVADRRGEMLRALEDRHETAAQAERILAALGVRVTRHRIGMWVARGKLEQLPGRLYRLGDVVAQAAGREAA